MLILKKNFPKKCHFEKFSTSESEKYGEIFSQFFAGQGKNDFWQNIHLCYINPNPTPIIRVNNDIIECAIIENVFNRC